jgi:2-polyprenyl-6-methoxyphenol hydroxylase-like FAD-dependent oxidoreductase
MTKALIIGGGIAGPVTAMALQRAGIDSIIYEARAPEETAGGAFLTVAVNGLDALRAIDAHGGVLECGFPSKTIELRSGTGKRLGAVPIGGELPDGTTTLSMRRTDLYLALLREAWDRGIPIEHGKRLLEAAPTPGGGVIARFEDGTEAAGDLLIGADGIYSRTRRIIDPAAPAPRYTGLGNIGGYCRVPSITGEPAIEDAVTLAQCLRDLPDTRSAFVAYEQMRRPRVERIVAWAARMNSSKAPGPMGRTVRDFILPLILKLQGSADSQRWIFNHHIEWEAEVSLGRAA